MRKPYRVDYFVNYGPDTRHLFECARFDRLREARAFISELRVNCAHQLVRMAFDGPYSLSSDKQIIAERVC